jgi:hypothetical protein
VKLFTAAKETAFGSDATSSRIAQLTIIDTLYAGIANRDYEHAFARIKRRARRPPASATNSSGLRVARADLARDEHDASARRARPARTGASSKVEHDQIGTRLGEGLARRAARSRRRRSRAISRPFALRRARARTARAREHRDERDAPRERRGRLRRAGRSDHGRAARGHRRADRSGGEFSRAPTAGVDLGGLRIAVLDIGGGSTECAVGTQGRVEAALSLELGSVRVGERFPELLGNFAGRPRTCRRGSRTCGDR